MKQQTTSPLPGHAPFPQVVGPFRSAGPSMRWARDRRAQSGGLPAEL